MRIRALVFFFITSVASLALAHEQKTALTEILVNERTGNLEIAHRFIIHDAEHSLYKATKLKNVDLAQSSAAQTAFASYVAKRFAIIPSNEKEPLKLTLVGQERERGYLWVYQETKIPSDLEPGFMVENRILHDAVEGQVNTVNVRYRSVISTLVFKENTGRKHYPGPAGARVEIKDSDETR